MPIMLSANLNDDNSINLPYKKSDMQNVESPEFLTLIKNNHTFHFFEKSVIIKRQKRDRTGWKI